MKSAYKSSHPHIFDVPKSSFGEHNVALPIVIDRVASHWRLFLFAMHVQRLGATFRKRPLDGLLLTRLARTPFNTPGTHAPLTRVECTPLNTDGMHARLACKLHGAMLCICHNSHQRLFLLSSSCDFYRHTVINDSSMPVINDPSSCDFSSSCDFDRYTVINDS